MKEQTLKILNKENIRLFFDGPVYPALICFIVALGSISGAEYFLNFIHTSLIIGALLICPTFKPLIISLCTYVYQVSVSHSPFYPNNSNYYVSGWRLPVSIITIILIASALVYFAIKNELYREISLKKTPLLIPLLVLSLAFLTNGIFSGVWVPRNLVLAAAHILVFLVLFLLVYHGLGKEKSADELAKYFAYISMLMALVISAEVIHLYLSSDDIFVNGSINKVGVALGWGIWNLIGVSAAVLIPMNFYGMVKNKHPWLYFLAATLIYFVAILSMSRNALLFATLSYITCIIIFSFIGEKKKTFRIIVAVGVALAAVLAVVFWDKIYSVFKDLFDRGLSDNGRFELWSAAFNNFLSSPVFGKGFYGLNAQTDTFGPFPESAHNTVFQLLSATGIFGFGAYVYYRVMTLRPFIKKPSLMKTMLGLSILTLLVCSLLDNFVFDIYPMFYATVALAIVFKKAEEES